MSVHLVTPTDGEVIPLGPTSLRVLEDGGHTGGRLGIIECTLLPASAGPPQHIHREHDETFLVVAGTVRFTSGEVDIDVEAGSLLTVPIGVPHTFANPDPERAATFVCTVTPDRYINYFRELSTLRPGPAGLDPAEVLQVMSRYATEPYRPAP
jgi:mannose-6-phosphate isomerase-like protein (cupin superfamily)